MVVILLAFGALISTFVGGSFALRFRDHLHLILGFSAGAVAGVALYDLLPEAISLGAAYHTPETIGLCVSLGLFGYLVLDRVVLLHAHDHGREEERSEGAQRGTFGALTLSIHSLLDGIAIGIGFQASAAVGAIVTVAVLTHDFSDGINTVSLVLRNDGSARQAFRWLLADASAPVLGAASTLFFRISDSMISLVLAVFVGTFLYLSASDLIPESYHRHPRALTTLMTLLGAATLYIVVLLAG